MSAYVCSDNHLNALVTFAVRERLQYRANGRTIQIDADKADEIVSILFDENYRSVHHRYQERTEGHFGKPNNVPRFRPFTSPINAGRTRKPLRSNSTLRRSSL